MVKAITPRWDAINSIEINAIPLKTTKKYNYERSKAYKLKHYYYDWYRIIMSTTYFRKQ